MPEGIWRNRPRGVGQRPTRNSILARPERVSKSGGGAQRGRTCNRPRPKPDVLGLAFFCRQLRGESPDRRSQRAGLFTTEARASTHSHCEGSSSLSASPVSLGRGAVSRKACKQSAATTFARTQQRVRPGTQRLRTVSQTNRQSFTLPTKAAAILPRACLGSIEAYPNSSCP